MQIIKHLKKSEYGRSMVEILGVLAVIGVLSIGAFQGYRYAFNKYQTNEIINELNIRANDISFRMNQLIENNHIGDIEMEMGNVMRTGYPIKARMHPQFLDFFEIFVSDVPTDVCKQILQSNWKLPFSTFVNVSPFEGDISVCEESETVELAYEFHKDLLQSDDMAEDERHEIMRCHHENDCKCGSCNSETGLCESYCTNTEQCVKDYDDSRWMVCCQKDYIVGDYCCASITEDGKCCNRSGNCCPPEKPLMGSNGTCYSCDYSGGITLTNPDSCSVVCPKRYLNNNHHKRCILCGVEGTSVADKPIWDYNGNCYACSNTSRISGGGETAAQQATEANCNKACFNRIKIGEYCVLATCPLAGYTLDQDGLCHADCPADKPLRSATGTCYACDTGVAVSVSGVTENCSVCPDRELKGTACILPTCPENKPLRGKNNTCYACDDTASIEMADTTSCTTTCPNRILNNTYHKRCILCGAKDTIYENQPIWDWTGKCYACDDPTRFSGGTETEARQSTEANCNRLCPNRQKMDQYCVLSTCPNTNQVLDQDGACRDKCPADKPLRSATGTCYACDTGVAVSVSGVTANCDVCPNRELKGTTCILPTCPADKPLRGKNNTCYSCDDTTSIEMSDTTSCTAICPQRILNNTYHKRCILCGVEGTIYENKPIWDWTGVCYSCDTSTNISGGSETLAQQATAANCSQACPNREKQGQYCTRITCPNGMFEKTSTKECYSCNITTPVPTTEEECMRCVNRKFENGYCVM